MQTILSKALAFIPTSETSTLSERPLQGDLFDTRNREKFNKVMCVMDSLNASYGKQTVKIAAQGFDRKWKLKNEKLSPCYSTKLADALEVGAE